MAISRAFSILKIFISPGHDFKGRHGKERLNHGVESVDSVECVLGRGLKGDRFFDFKENFKGQITFFEQSVFEAVSAALEIEDLDVAQMRRNVIVSGVELNELVGKEFEIQGVRFLGTEECAPCYWMNDAVGEGAEELMKGRGGLRCRILSSGTLSLGKATVTEVEV